MADSIDRRLSVIERKLGIEDEQMNQEFARNVSERLDRIDRNIRQIRHAVFGDEVNQKGLKGLEE